MSMAWEPDHTCRSNFFSPPAHLCAITRITEILLIMTLKEKERYLTLSYDKRTYTHRQIQNAT